MKLRKYKYKTLHFLGGKFQCRYCFKELSNKYNLKVHVRDIHEQPEWEELACPFCSKYSKSKSALRTHINDYHKEMK